MEKELNTPIVLLVCPGAGAIKRGFEAFIFECFEELSKNSTELSLYLARGGGGPSKGRERKVYCLSRFGPIATLFGKLFRKHPYFIEQVSFAASLFPTILMLKPDVIYLSDGTLANVLWRIRKIFRFSYKILFSNGGPSSPPYPKCDHIQQLTEASFKEGNVSKVSQSLLPYGFKFVSTGTEAKKNEFREKLGLPPETPIIISVAALDKRHKRIDYLVKEIARLPSPRPHLLLLGDSTDETKSITELATELLGKEGFTAKTSEAREVTKYLKASNIFVLPSVTEGFGRAVVEAGEAPLSCIVHDSENMRFILREHGHYIDMEKEGELSQKIKELLEGRIASNLTAQSQELRERFSWEMLGGSYIKMILSLTQSDSV